MRRGAFSVSLRGRSKDIHGYYRVIISILFIEIDFYLKKTGGGGEKKILRKRQPHFQKDSVGRKSLRTPALDFYDLFFFFILFFEKTNPTHIRTVREFYVNTLSSIHVHRIKFKWTIAHPAKTIVLSVCPYAFFIVSADNTFVWLVATVRSQYGDTEQSYLPRLLLLLLLVSL